MTHRIRRSVATIFAMVIVAPGLHGQDWGKTPHPGTETGTRPPPGEGTDSVQGTARRTVIEGRSVRLPEGADRLHGHLLGSEGGIQMVRLGDTGASDFRLPVSADRIGGMGLQPTGHTEDRLHESVAMIATSTVEGSAAENRVHPHLNLMVGVGAAPGEPSPCTRTSFSHLGVTAGAQAGPWGVEGRVSLREMRRRTICVADWYPPEGVQTTRFPDHEPEDSDVATDLRVRVGATPRIPLLVAAGFGRTWLEGLWYGTAAAGLRTRGRLHLAADVEHTWYRVPVREMTLEWESGRVVRIIEDRREIDWNGATSMRVGLELPLR